MFYRRGLFIVRILHTADWHLGKNLEGRSRLPEQEEFIDELCEIVEQEKIDVILMAGDVFDSVNPPAAAEQLFYESVTRLTNHGQRKMMVIAGNHDHPGRLVAASTLASLQGITLVGYPSKQAYRFLIPGCDQYLNLAPLAYPSESRLLELLEDELEEEALQLKYDQKIAHLFQEMTSSFSPQEINIAMSHLFIAGGDPSDSERPIQVGGAYTVYPSSLPHNVQYVALGHLHRPQTIHKAPTLARYSGSPLAYSFSEAGYSKSVTILDLQPGQQASMNEIFLRSGKPLVKWRALEGMTEIYRWIEEGRDPQAWIDVEVHVPHSLSLEEIHRLRKIHPGILNIKPVFPAMEMEIGQAVDRQLPVDQLFRQFYVKQSGGAEPEDELVRLFLEFLQEEEDQVLEKGDATI